jgi:hypothetical protein
MSPRSREDSVVDASCYLFFLCAPSFSFGYNGKNSGIQGTRTFS